MIFKLRKGNKTVCDVEVTTQKENGKEYIELRSSVFVAGYSEVLAKHMDEMLKVIKDFEEIEELRGWLWERHLHNNNVYTIENYRSTIDYVKNILSKVAKEYDLYYVED